MSSGEGRVISAAEAARFRAEYERRQQVVAEAARRRQAAEVRSCRGVFDGLLAERAALVGVAGELEVVVGSVPVWPSDVNVASAQAAVRAARQAKARLEGEIEAAKAGWERDRGRIAAAVARRERLDREAAELRMVGDAQLVAGGADEPSQARASAGAAEASNDAFSERIGQERKALSSVRQEIAQEVGKRERLIAEASRMNVSSPDAPMAAYADLSCLEEARRQLDDVTTDMARVKGFLDQAYRVQSLAEADEVWAAIKPVGTGVDLWAANEPWRKAMRTELGEIVGRLGASQGLPDEVARAMDTVESALSEGPARASVAAARRAADALTDRLDRLEEIRQELDRMRDVVGQIPSSATASQFARLETEFESHSGPWTDDQLYGWIGVRLPGMKRDIETWIKKDEERRTEAEAEAKRELAEVVVALACASLDIEKDFEIVGAVGLERRAGLEHVETLGGHTKSFMPSGVGFVARCRGDMNFAIMGRTTGNGGFELMHANIDWDDGSRVDSAVHQIACERVKGIIKNTVEPYVMAGIEAGYAVSIDLTDDRSEIWAPTPQERDRMTTADEKWAILNQDQAPLQAKTIG